MRSAAALAVLALVSLAPLALASDEIAIRSFAYAPNPLEVAPGHEVRVVNRDAAPHSVTAAGAFDSGVLDQDASGTFTAPEEPGTYVYICSVHGASMRGTLVVRNASAAPTPAPTPVATPTPAATPTPEATPTPASPTPTATPAASPSAQGGAANDSPGPALALVLAAVAALALLRRR